MTPRAPKGPLLHESGRKHATGEALYVDDERRPVGTLSLWPVVSPHARARIVARRVDAARAAEGVRAVLLAEDVPGLNDVGPIRHDEPLLAHAEVMFRGQVVAAVVADDEESARLAAGLVEVDYEPLEAVTDLEAAIERGDFLTDPHVIRRGDPDRALEEAPRTLEGTLAVGGQEHFYLETHAAFAEPREDGALFCASSTQHPSEVQATIAHVLGIARSQVVVESPRMGGGFGGKETQGAAWAALCALGARATGRPVRVRLHREQDMTMTGKRHRFFGRYAAGFDDEGRLLALKVALFSDGGCSLDLSESIMDRALFHADNAYYVPHLEAVGRVARTNLPSNTAFRGFGGPQGMLFIEEVLDAVARRLGLAPEVVRERNLYAEGEKAAEEPERATTHYLQPIGDVRIRRIWTRLTASADLAGRRAEIAAWNAAHRHERRGIAITPVKFGISFTASFLNQAGALVLVYQDGSVQLNHGGTEMGQGLFTKMLSVCARELGVRPEAIRPMRTRTDKVPNTSATAASSGSDLNGQAVADACRALRRRLAPVAADLLGERGGARPDPDGLIFADGAVTDPSDRARSIEIAEVAQAAYFRQVQLAATGYYATPDLRYDKATGTGRPFHYFAFGAAVSEVEVSGFTGMWRPLRTDILHDVGSSLNPEIDRGQIEGGFVQGIGWLTMEELVWAPDGRLLTSGPSTYKVPAIGDAPRDLRVDLLPDAAQPGVIHGSKAVGEPPFMLAFSVREAIRDAVASFGPGGADVPLGCPATTEAILMAIEAQRVRSRG